MVVEHISASLQSFPVGIAGGIPSEWLSPSKPNGCTQPHPINHLAAPFPPKPCRSMYMMMLQNVMLICVNKAAKIYVVWHDPAVVHNNILTVDLDSQPFSPSEKCSSYTCLCLCHRALAVGHTG